MLIVLLLSYARSLAAIVLYNKGTDKRRQAYKTQRAKKAKDEQLYPFFLLTALQKKKKEIFITFSEHIATEAT